MSDWNIGSDFCSSNDMQYLKWGRGVCFSDAYDIFNELLHENCDDSQCSFEFLFANNTRHFPLRYFWEQGRQRRHKQPN
jgi:hypothetical protein